MKEQYVELLVDGCGLVVGQKELYSREHGAKVDVVLTRGGVTDNAVVFDHLLVPKMNVRKENTIMRILFSAMCLVVHSGYNHRVGRLYK